VHLQPPHERPPLLRSDPTATETNIVLSGANMAATKTNIAAHETNIAADHY
jgi:hypothetical protein